MTTKRRAKRTPSQPREAVPSGELQAADEPGASPVQPDAQPEPPQAGVDEVAQRSRTSDARDPGADEAATTVQPTRERSREPGPDDVAIPATPRSS
jgi:hypothetical protein